MQAKIAADPVAAAQLKAYQAAMASPEAQKQMAEMNSFMRNPQVQERLASMATDPELKHVFEVVSKEGPAALMKYWNDHELLAKISAKLGAVAVPASPPPAPPTKPPEITNLLDAARWGDLEAVEDFLAVGKGDFLTAADAEQRSALHYAVANGRGDVGEEVVALLLKAGAKPDATDSKGNTTLHYAVGYGRAEYAVMLLDAGASVAARNATGKTAGELAAANPANPVLQDAALMKRLAGGISFTD